MSDDKVHGRSTYLKYKCRCEVCVKANSVYRKNIRQSVLRLDADRFIDRLTKDGRITSIHTGVISKWRQYGLDIFQADRWAVKYGYHPYEIWGNDFYKGCNE